VTAAVFVDRDGVINELVPDPVSGAPESPLRPDDVRLLDGAADALRRLAGAGWKLIGVSNQPAAAKGTISLDELQAVQARVLALLAAEGVTFDDFRLCLHHPAGIVPELSGPCDCRKPAPGMLQEAATAHGIDLTRSWMIGDTDADVAAGRAAKCATILVENPDSAHKRVGSSRADRLVPDLAAAVTFILRPKG
jgi:D-glycero-D-manno-heptose 1,7-bisphosphate phosphatase